MHSTSDNTTGDRLYPHTSNSKDIKTIIPSTIGGRNSCSYGCCSYCYRCSIDILSSHIRDTSRTSSKSPIAWCSQNQSSSGLIFSNITNSSFSNNDTTQHCPSTSGCISCSISRDVSTTGCSSNRHCSIYYSSTRQQQQRHHKKQSFYAP